MDFPRFSFTFRTLAKSDPSIWVFHDLETLTVRQHWLPGDGQKACINCPQTFQERCAFCDFVLRQPGHPLSRQLALYTRIYLNALYGRQLDQTVLTLTEMQWQALKPNLVKNRYLFYRSGRWAQGAECPQAAGRQVMNLQRTLRLTTAEETDQLLAGLRNKKPKFPAGGLAPA